MNATSFENKSDQLQNEEMYSDDYSYQESQSLSK